MKQSENNKNTLLSLISSTSILRSNFGFISIFGALSGLYIENSFIYSTFNSEIDWISRHSIFLFAVIISSLLLIGDAMLSMTVLIKHTKFVKFLCRIFLKIRWIFWLPGVFMFLYVSYNNAYTSIINDNRLFNILITSGYYMALAILGLFSLFNESVIANNMVKNCDEKQK